MTLLYNYAIQIFIIVLVIVVFGTIVSISRQFFFRINGNKGHKIMFLTGFIGVPIHELSHAFMCILFRHKITDIKLYRPFSLDGNLGYVSHTYNKRTISANR